MARIRRDIHGLFIRQAGQIYRPEFSDRMFTEMCIRPSLTGGPNRLFYDYMIKDPEPYLFTEGESPATSDPDAGSITLYEHNYKGGRNTHREYWFNHGFWNGDSTTCWVPCDPALTHSYFK